ncbi:MAG: hypothetical protein HY247_08205 [archaeon]|nr:MAG: hypothetical protein HY247_08205 [archaeon]
MPSQLVAIPLDHAQPHPRLAFRFKYDVSSLADSIRAAADDAVPNGQLNPGRVIRRKDEDGYYVYIGVRRFLALKQLSQKTKDRRFDFYNAYVDEGLTEMQMFVRARAENEDGKGERQGLSVLEQASGLLKVRGPTTDEELDSSLKRLLSVAEKLGEERLKKLYDVERASRSKYSLTQLEHLCEVEGEKEFYTTAASTAEFGIEDADAAEKSRKAAYSLNWFPKLFPNIKPEEAAQVPKRAVAEKHEQPMEVHEEAVLVASCPRCGGGNMFQVKGEIDVTQLPPNPEGAKETKVAETLSRVACNCSHCGKEFFLLVRPLEGRAWAVSSHFSATFMEPEGKMQSVDLRFDHETNSWQKVVEGKVAGPLQLPLPRMKR